MFSLRIVYPRTFSMMHAHILSFNYLGKLQGWSAFLVPQFISTLVFVPCQLFLVLCFRFVNFLFILPLFRWSLLCSPLQLEYGVLPYHKLNCSLLPNLCFHFQFHSNSPFFRITILGVFEDEGIWGYWVLDLYGGGVHFSNEKRLRNEKLLLCEYA